MSWVQETVERNRPQIACVIDQERERTKRNDVWASLPAYYFKGQQKLDFVRSDDIISHTISGVMSEVGLKQAVTERHFPQDHKNTVSYEVFWGEDDDQSFELHYLPNQRVYLYHLKESLRACVPIILPYNSQIKANYEAEDALYLIRTSIDSKPPQLDMRAAIQASPITRHNVECLLAVVLSNPRLRLPQPVK